MTRLRECCVLFLTATLLLVQARAAQDGPSDDAASRSPAEKLKLITIGEEFTRAGHRGSFRIYAAPDGTKAEIHYIHFRSAQDAERQTKEWLKLAHRVISKAQNKDESGHVIGTRFVAIGQKVESAERDHLIIRRSNLDCYLIQSISLPVAEQVEELIKGSKFGGRPDK